MRFINSGESGENRKNRHDSFISMNRQEII